MALFLSTHINKMDAKGRVSVPSSFRAALSGEAFQGVVLFESFKDQAVEGVPLSFMETVSNRMDAYDLFSQDQDDLATAVFAQSVQLPFDGDGRIILPRHIIDFGGFDGRVAFVGLGKKFQIWSPENLETRQKQARQTLKEKGLTLPSPSQGGFDGKS